jgi:hypothetical protein
VSINPDVAHYRARIANAVQRGDQETADTGRRDLRVAQLADHIAKVVKSAPPITPEQRARLASLLSGGSDAA